MEVENCLCCWKLEAKRTTLEPHDTRSAVATRKSTMYPGGRGQQYPSRPSKIPDALRRLLPNAQTTGAAQHVASERATAAPSQHVATNKYTAGTPQRVNPLEILETAAQQSTSAQFVDNILEQDVLEYLSKKGYSRTEAMLRRESQNVDPDGKPPGLQRPEEVGGRGYIRAYEMIMHWIDGVLDIYKPELKRLLWPLFVYTFLTLVDEFYTKDSQDFFTTHRASFEAEHSDDLRTLAPISLPEHLADNTTAKIYRNAKYRLTLSQIAYMTFVQYLESKDRDGGPIILQLIFLHMDLRQINRAAAGNERSLSKILAKPNEDQEVPAEDEGIPGHHPGSANLDRNAPTVLSKLSLGQPPMEAELMEDVKAELQEMDAANPPAPGVNSLTEEFEQRIKREPLDDTAPSREGLPFPPSTARDVAMEVQRVKENRDRFQIAHARTGGVGPGISVCMFTLHNTFDSINCIEFSGDNTLLAAGTSESYIRVWSLDNKPLTSPTDHPTYQPSSSRRLIGHSGPVYALSFSPSLAIPNLQTSTGQPSSKNTPDAYPKYLLSSSADNTIRLWSLHVWTCLVVYKSHQSPVWDVRFSPFGHYFITCSADRTARLWSTPQIAPLRIFAGHDADVETIAWHPNSAYVITGSGGADRTVRMWDVQRGGAVRIFTGHTGNVTAISCSPTGKIIASADDRGDIILWDIASGRLIKRMRGHSRGGIWSLDWSVESTVLVSAGADGTVRVWDVQPKNDANGKIISEGGSGVKIDGLNTSATGTAKGKAKKDVVVSPDQISAFPTKKSPVYKYFKHFDICSVIQKLVRLSETRRFDCYDCEPLLTSACVLARTKRICFWKEMAHIALVLPQYRWPALVVRLEQYCSSLAFDINGAFPQNDAYPDHDHVQPLTVINFVFAAA
ncbi:hypothetical protein MRB53_038532 [Persea americana]|nr:hypothetical protein MRB53_038532 [Persea americana]